MTGQRVLIGTTNPSKVDKFTCLLRGYTVECVTPRDLNITQEPEETGNTPEENAIIKARYYGKFADRVICADSGLYFRDLGFQDPRQPGLHVRTPQGIRLTDDEMIAYYTQLIHGLGGRVSAYYLDGIAACCGDHVVSMSQCYDSFDMVDHVSSVWHEGWPLDSISIFQKKRAESESSGDERITRFLAEALKLNDETYKQEL